MQQPVVLPDDELNRALVANVHPEHYANPVASGRYNLVVIGAGTAGLITAAGAAGLGARVALVERHLLGGDCLNVGCVPSKALISSARAIADVRDAHKLGVHVPDGYRLDFGAVMERMRRLRAGISHHDSAKRFSGLGVDMFIGEAKFTGRDSVEVPFAIRLPAPLAGRLAVPAGAVVGLDRLPATLLELVGSRPAPALAPSLLRASPWVALSELWLANGHHEVGLYEDGHQLRWRCWFAARDPLYDAAWR